MWNHAPIDLAMHWEEGSHSPTASALFVHACWAVEGQATCRRWGSAAHLESQS